MLKAPESIRVLWTNKKYFQITLLQMWSEYDYECWDLFYYSMAGAFLVAIGYKLDNMRH